MILRASDPKRKYNFSYHRCFFDLSAGQVMVGDFLKMAHPLDMEMPSVVFIGMLILMQVFHHGVINKVGIGEIDAYFFASGKRIQGFFQFDVIAENR